MRIKFVLFPKMPQESKNTEILNDFCIFCKQVLFFLSFGCLGTPSGLPKSQKNYKTQWILQFVCSLLWEMYVFLEFCAVFALENSSFFFEFSSPPQSSGVWKNHFVLAQRRYRRLRIYKSLYSSWEWLSQPSNHIVRFLFSFTRFLFLGTRRFFDGFRPRRQRYH